MADRSGSWRRAGGTETLDRPQLSNSPSSRTRELGCLSTLLVSYDLARELGCLSTLSVSYDLALLLAHLVGSRAMDAGL